MSGFLSGKTSPTNIVAADIADDAVVQAAVADEAVNEVRLQVSNTPTNGYFLSAQSGNTGGLTWAAAGGGGTAVLARATFSNQSAVPITAFDNSNYDAYKIYWEITPSADGADLRYRTSSNGGSSYDSGGSDYRWRHIINDGGSPPVDFTVDGAEGRSTRRNSNAGLCFQPVLENML